MTDGHRKMRYTVNNYSEKFRKSPFRLLIRAWAGKQIIEYYVPNKV